MAMRTYLLCLLLAPLGWAWGQQSAPFTDQRELITTGIDVQLRQQDSLLQVRYCLRHVRRYHRYDLRLVIRSQEGDYYHLDWQGDSLHNLSDTLWREVHAVVPGTPLAGYQGYLQAIMEVDTITYEPNERGPEYAMFSLLVPGLGNYLVSDARKYENFLATSLLFGGSLLGGIYAYQTDNYVLSGLFLTTASTVYLMDVIGALTKGARNKQRRAERLDAEKWSAPVVQLHIAPAPMGMALQLRF